MARLNRGWCAVVTGVAAICVGVAAPHAIRPVSGQGGAQGFTFALIGDLGYVPDEQTATENVFADISADTALSFVVHDGDLSSPRFACTDEMQQHRLAQFNAMPHPVIFTPGDGPIVTTGKTSKAAIRSSGWQSSVKSSFRAITASANGRCRSIDRAEARNSQSFARTHAGICKA